MRLAGGDSRLSVRFERKTVINAFRSELEGRPIYEEKDYVRIQQPGERDVYNQEVKEEHKYRFPQQWRQFLEHVEQIPEGTPVKVLFPNQGPLVETMLDLKIFTVEQLAELTEHAIERLGMDGRKCVQKAKAFLDKAEAFKEVTRLTQELGALKDQNKVLAQANARMQDRMQQLEDRLRDEALEFQPLRRGPGRPPKQRQEEEPQRIAPPIQPPERPEVVG